MAIEPNQAQVNAEQTAIQQKKKSFVSEKDTPPVGTPSEGEVKVISCEVSLMMIYKQLKTTNDLLTEIRNVLQSGISQTKPVVKVETPKVETAQKTEAAPIQGSSISTPIPTPTSISPRLQEILTALEPVKELVYVDEEASANDNMFFIIRPRQFLGQENFSKVATIMRTIGAQYQSAGKNSHFKASKAGKS